MTLTVYGVPLSPFVRKVRLLLAEKALDYQMEFIGITDQPEWYRDISPLGRIPALRDGDLTLADSSVIAQYLEEQYPRQLALYGVTAKERGRIRWLEKYADYELAPLTTFTVFFNRIIKPSLLGQPCDEIAVQYVLQNKLPQHLDYLEKQLSTDDYFVENRLSMADLAIGCQLINLEHGGEMLDAARWSGLHGFLQRLKARASLQALLPGEQRMLTKLLNKDWLTAKAGP